MQAFTSIPMREPEKKLMQALIAFMGLKIYGLILCSLVALAILLYTFMILVSACLYLCEQIGAMYATCNPLEKIFLFLLAWAICAWAFRLVRSLKHARV